MSETPIFAMPEYQGRLTDREIENRVTESEERGDFNLWEEEMVNPSLFETPEVNHEAIQPPTYEAPTQQELLRQSIEAIPDSELVAATVADMTVIGRNLSAERSRAQGHSSFPAAA